MRTSRVWDRACHRYMQHLEEKKLSYMVYTLFSVNLIKKLRASSFLCCFWPCLYRCKIKTKKIHQELQNHPLLKPLVVSISTYLSMYWYTWLLFENTSWWKENLVFFSSIKWMYCDFVKTKSSCGMCEFCRSLTSVV